MRPRDPVLGIHACIGIKLMQIFRDRQRIPNAGPLMRQPRYQNGRRQQQKLRPVLQIFQRNHLFSDAQSRQSAQQPAAQ